MISWSWWLYNSDRNDIAKIKTNLFFVKFLVLLKGNIHFVKLLTRLFVMYATKNDKERSHHPSDDVSLPAKTPSHLIAAAPPPLFCPVCNYWGNYRCAILDRNLDCEKIHPEMHCERRTVQWLSYEYWTTSKFSFRTLYLLCPIFVSCSVSWLGKTAKSIFIFLFFSFLLVSKDWTCEIVGWIGAYGTWQIKVKGI